MTTKPALDPVELYISGVGRMGRVLFVPALALVIVAYEFYQRAGSLVHWITGWIVYPVLACMTASLLSKRLHDRGAAGWWSALPILAYPLMRPWPQGIVGGVALGFALWFGVSLAILPGGRSFNRFGPRP